MYFEDEIDVAHFRKRFAHANDGERARIMIVEDDRVSMLFLERELVQMGADVESVSDAEAAWALLTAAPQQTDIILLDRGLPNMDGTTFLKKLKETPSLNHIPVILQTVDSSPASLREGIEMGAFYYLTKPVDSFLLQTIVRAALREVALRQNLNAQLAVADSGIAYMTEAKFSFQTIPQAHSLARFLARDFLDSDIIAEGLAALMINAIEHGNLGIGYDEKLKCLSQNTYKSEIRRRLKTPPYNQRHVTLSVSRDQSETVITITDQGEGFAWRDFIDFDHERVGAPNGRGINRTRLKVFPDMNYNDVGNAVTLRIPNERRAV